MLTQQITHNNLKIA